MASRGTYKNPEEKPCWRTCQACGRCANNGMWAGCGRTCSGRWDPDGTIDPYPDDFCQCAEGTLRWRTKKGELIVAKINKNPFETHVITEKITDDEKDWDGYLNDMREKLDDENWDPIKFT